MTRKSSKSRRKQKLKKYRLKEGSPDEDLAHIAALAEIVVKVDSLKDNFVNTLKALVQFGFDSTAQTLQNSMNELINLVESQMSEIWGPSERNFSQSDLKFGPDSTSNSIAAQMLTERPSVNVIQSDPELAQPPWRKIDCGLQMFR